MKLSAISDQLSDLCVVCSVDPAEFRLRSGEGFCADCRKQAEAHAAIPEGVDFRAIR